MTTPSLTYRAGPPGALCSQLYSMMSGYFPEAMARLNCSSSALSGGGWGWILVLGRVAAAWLPAISGEGSCARSAFGLYGRPLVIRVRMLTVTQPTSFTTRQRDAC